MRIANIDRKTAETDISLSLNLDGTGACEISTGCGFMDHMLTLFAHHAGFDLKDDKLPERGICLYPNEHKELKKGENMNEN